MKFGQIARLVEKYLQTGETGTHHRSQTNKKEEKKPHLGSLMTQNLLTNSSVFSRRLYKLQVLYTTVKEKIQPTLTSQLSSGQLCRRWRTSDSEGNVAETSSEQQRGGGAAADGRHRVAQAWGGGDKQMSMR